MQNVLADIDIRNEAGTLDEQIFADWPEQNLEEIHRESYQDNYEGAGHRQGSYPGYFMIWSPIHRCINKMTADLCTQMEVICYMKYFAENLRPIPNPSQAAALQSVRCVTILSIIPQNVTFLVHPIKWGGFARHISMNNFWLEQIPWMQIPPHMLVRDQYTTTYTVCG
jgi:hypothetical protein